MSKIDSRPLSVYLLASLILIQSLGGISGGISFIISPDGNLLQIPLSSVRNFPFNDFLIPGLILFLLLGIYPFLIFISFFKSTSWRWMEYLNIHKGQKSVWTNSLYLGIILILWIDIEIIYIDYSALQTIFGLFGVAIVVLTLLPSNMKYYKI